jgi:hypothetical protein
VRWSLREEITTECLGVDLITIAGLQGILIVNMEETFELGSQERLFISN